MNELVQLYDEQGRAISGKGGTKSEIFGGLLHGGVHVWIWRQQDNNVEILVQKRAPHKLTWPNFYDISAAGHIDLGEDPIQTAIRETKEELGISVYEKDLKSFGIHRAYLITEDGSIENEFQWTYLLKLEGDQKFTIQKSEVELVEWIDFDDFKQEIENNPKSKKFVPQGRLYFDKVIDAIERESGAS